MNQYLTTHFVTNCIATDPGEETRYEDTDLSGFCLEFTQELGWHFCLRKNMDGHMTSYFLGSASQTSTQQSRQRAKMLSSMLSAWNPHARDKGRNLFQEFVNTHYLPYAKVKKRSWRLDKRLIEQYLYPRFRNRPMDSVDTADVLAWQEHMLETGLSQASCNRAYSLLKSLFNCAIRWELLPEGKNPCRHVRALSEGPSRACYLSENDARKVLQELDRWPNPTTAAAIKLLLFTGARRNEVLSAQWGHVDFSLRLLKVPLSKSGKTRYIPLSHEALSVLNSLPRNGKWIFPGDAEGQRHMSSLFYAWNTIRGRLGLNNVRLHDLRHTFASLLINSGHSLYEVQKILGHHDPRITMRYAHLDTVTIIQAVDDVGSRIGTEKKRKD
ncbi:tyrosine-type recombinase/integrase [Mailhella massiliensis]|uniref:tyrosine-type recombinase/integrase n=1 Tax=Mailhella massiliensis TaxID=1903261 RepID=UPI0023F084A0|nr:site-specific integrase [Mailhella massiliensis]